MGGAIGAVHRTEISRIVRNILEKHKHPIEIRVRPEALPHVHHFTVEWEYLEYNREKSEWESLSERYL